MIAGCLLSAVLLVVPAHPGNETYFPARWMVRQVVLSGVCNYLFGRGKIIVENRKLIILYVGEKYIIPFPPKVGRWPFFYWIGDDECDLGVWGRVQVRRGPELPI